MVKPTLALAKQLARGATTPKELVEALEVAREAAILDAHTGPERRKEHREPFHSCPACQPCPAEGCELFGVHDLHRDSEGFQWRQVTA